MPVVRIPADLHAHESLLPMHGPPAAIPDPVHVMISRIAVVQPEKNKRLKMPVAKIELVLSCILKN